MGYFQTHLGLIHWTGDVRSGYVITFPNRGQWALPPGSSLEDFIRVLKTRL